MIKIDPCPKCGGALMRGRSTRNENIIYSDIICSLCGTKVKVQVKDLLKK